MSDATFTAQPPFVTLDNRTPGPIRQLMREADGCHRAGLLTGGTVCAQRAIHSLLQHENVGGDTYEARMHALSQAYPAVPKSLFVLCARLGGSRAEDIPALDAHKLHVLIVAVKIILYEIYVLAPERVNRLKYLQQLVESLERGAHHAAVVAAIAG